MLKRVMALSIHPLDLGDIELDTSFVAWQTNCGEKIWVPTTAWLILGTDKPIMVDSSFRSVEDARANQGLNCRRSAEQELEFQLARHDLKLSDIGTLVHTHLHMDHAGQDYLLPNAQIVLQRAELQNAAAPNFYPAPFYDNLNIARLVNDLGSRVEFLDGESELFPGIRTVFTPGHTPAHQAIYVETSTGVAVIAGDAVLNEEWNVRQGIAPGIVDSMSDVLNSVRRIQSDAKYILPTHDPTVFERYANGIA